MPWARTESARPAPASESKRRRGWRGFGWMASTGSSASSDAFAPPRRTSRPLPRPLRSGTLDKLHRHLPVGVRAARTAVVRNCGQAVARRLREADRARDGLCEHQLAEVLADFG